MHIKTEFIVGDLEYSEIMSKTYSWAAIMATTWPDGWRIPTKLELPPNCDEFYWAADQDPRLLKYNLIVRLVRNIIKPSFIVRELQFSEPLKRKYAWDDLMHIQWQGGWRVPRLWELTMLYEEEPKSHTEDAYWSSTPAAGLSWCVDFYGGAGFHNYRSRPHSVTLVREVKEFMPFWRDVWYDAEANALKFIDELPYRDSV